MLVRNMKMSTVWKIMGVFAIILGTVTALPVVPIIQYVGFWGYVALGLGILMITLGIYAIYASGKRPTSIIEELE